MIKELQKQLDNLAKMQASNLRQFDKALKGIQRQNPELAKKLIAMKEHAQSGKADPSKIIEEVIKLAQQ